MLNKSSKEYVLKKAEKNILKEDVLNAKIGL